MCTPSFLIGSESQRLTSARNDASNFNIYLTNNEVYPPVNKKVASDVKASKESYTVDSLDATAGCVSRARVLLKLES